MQTDFFDALLTRGNNKGLLPEGAGLAEQQALMLERFTDAAVRINWLFEYQLAA